MQEELGSDFIRPIDSMEDGRIFTMVFSGGLTAAEITRDKWRLVPRLVGGRPSVTGHYTKNHIRSIMGNAGYRFIAFKSIDIVGGEQTTHWVPFIRGELNFSVGPRDLWGNIASNLGRLRTENLLKPGLTRTQTEAIIDASGDIERLAGSIRSSLQNLDSSVEYLAGFYHEELMTHLAAGRIDGSGISTTRDQAFYAMVQSFFLHLGATRDYLAAFIAAQLGKDPHKTDSMAKLIDVVRADDFDRSPLLRFFVDNHLIGAKGAPSTKYETTGWLEFATELRNEFVHRRTYGQKHAERMGRLRSANDGMGLFRYHRNIVMPTITEGTDVLEVVLDCYETVNFVLYSCARLGGENTSIRTLTDVDVVRTP